MSLPSELKRLYKRGEGWREFFDALAEYQKPTKELTAERGAQITGLHLDTIMAGMKELARLKIGTFRFGRRGGKTRLVWNYSPGSVGRVAQGRQEELEGYLEGEEAPEEEISEDVSEMPIQTAPVALPIPLLIEQAKRTLAEQLGVAFEQIEITIRY